jgi:putative peptidoglycan lipid II flippase
MIFTLIAVIPTFIFPRLCDLAAEDGAGDGFRTLLAKGAHATVLLALPVSAVVWGLRRPLIEVVYQRGAFDAAAAQASALLLGFYALGIAAHCFNNLLVHVFYARREMRVRIGYGLVFLAANTGLNLLLVGRLGAPAIALANTAAAWICSAYLLVLLRRRLAAPIARLGPVVWKSALTAVVLAAAVALVERAVPGPALLRLGVAAGLAAGGFLGLVRGLRIEGAVYLWDLLKLARAR